MAEVKRQRQKWATPKLQRIVAGSAEKNKTTVGEGGCSGSCKQFS